LAAGVAQPRIRPPYYLDDVVFADAAGVNVAYLVRQQRRGGPGVVELRAGDDGQRHASHDIVLERHSKPFAQGREWRCK